jgi:transposase-like protein
MTKTEGKAAIAAVNELFAKSPDGLREIVRAVMQEMLDAEMTDARAAEKGEYTTARLGYRSGHYTRTLITRVGKLELRVPQDRSRPRASPPSSAPGRKPRRLCQTPPCRTLPLPHPQRPL